MILIRKSYYLPPHKTVRIMFEIWKYEIWNGGSIEIMANNKSIFSQIFNDDLTDLIQIDEIMLDENEMFEITLKSTNGGQMQL